MRNQSDGRKREKDPRPQTQIGTGELVNNTQSGSRLERSKVGTEEESDGYDGAFRAQVCFAGEPVCPRPAGEASLQGSARGRENETDA